MMISIRRGTFETNSSSVHAICIPDEGSADVDRLDCGQYGWETAEYPAANYIWQAIVDNYGDDPGMMERWKDAIRNVAGDVEFGTPDGMYSYVDHPGETVPMLEALLADPGLLSRALSPGAFVITGNDNGMSMEWLFDETNEMLSHGRFDDDGKWIPDTPEDDFYEGVFMRLPEHPGMLIYEKRN